MRPADRQHDPPGAAGTSTAPGRSTPHIVTWQAPNRSIAFKRLEVAKQHQVLGGAPGDYSEAAAGAAEGDGHGAEEHAGEALDEVA